MNASMGKAFLNWSLGQSSTTPKVIHFLHDLFAAIRQRQIARDR